jgi:hypothetical protein
MKKRLILFFVLTGLVIVGLMKSCQEILLPKPGQARDNVLERDGKLYVCEPYYAKAIGLIQELLARFEVFTLK